MKKHFVNFYSPGTLVSEVSSKPIESWDVAKAMEMAKSIQERYSATPYGFRFETRERGEEDLDSHVSQISPMYFLGGKIETLEEVEVRNDPSESILRSNMRNNGHKRVITNTNSWKVTLPFEDDCVLLDWPMEGQ